MRYLTLIGLLSKTVRAIVHGGSVILLTNPEVERAADPSSVCYAHGYHPLMLRSQDVESVRQKLAQNNVKYAYVAGWNGTRQTLLLGAAAGTVTPFAPELKTCSVLCVSKKAPAVCKPAPIQCHIPQPKKCLPAPCAIIPAQPVCKPICEPICKPVCNPICKPVCTPCPPFNPCWPPRILVDNETCPPLCCLPKKCIPKRRIRPCDSPCVVNYNPRKVYVIDELTVSCGPFLRIVETRCRRPFERERIFTISKLLPPFVPVPFPSVLRNAALLHKILCEARERFGLCGCVCLFIDYYNNIYIAVDCEYYKVVIRRPNFPWRQGFRPFPPIFPPSFPGGFPGGFGDNCDTACPPRINCSPCAPVSKCRPMRRTDNCGRPCAPSDFIFCKIRCEEMVHIKRRGLFAVLFSRPTEC